MKKCRKSAGRHRPRGVWDGASPAGIWEIRSSGKSGRRPASRQRSEDHDTKVPGQPLPTFSQTACNAINTIWELQALNIPVIYEKEGIKTCSPDTETLINLSAAFAKAESGPDRKVAGSISKPGLPPVLPAGALSLSVRNDGRAQSPSRTTSMEAPEAPLASWTLSTPGMLGVVEYA